MLNSRHIEIFYSIYKYKTLTNAAKILNVSQPALSKSLQYSEHKLNLKLFSKSSGMLIPTPEADLLYKHAEKINLSVKEFNQMAENLIEKPVQSIEIGVTPSLGGSFLPGLIAKFNELEPNIRFTLVTNQSHELLDKLHDFSHDVIFCYNPPKLEQYKRIVLKSGEMVFVISKDSKSYLNQSYFELKNLAKEPLIKINNILSPVIDDKNLSDFSLDAYLDEKKIKPQWIASTESFYVAKKMVEQGIAGAVIDATTASSGDLSNLRILKLKPSIKYKIVSLSNPNKPKSVAVIKFLEFLSKQKKGEQAPL